MSINLNILATNKTILNIKKWMKLFYLVVLVEN